MAKLAGARGDFADIVPYDPKYLPADELLSANENPEDVPAEVRQAIDARFATMAFNRYPDPLANELRDTIAQAYGLERNYVLAGNGGDELLFNLALCWGGPGRTFLNVPPTFSVYAANAKLTGTAMVEVPRRDDFTIDEAAVLDRVAQGGIDFIVITSPNNPTGDCARQEFLLELLGATDALVLVDEAYAEFSGQSIVPYLREYQNLAVLRTFSKAYSLAGVRVGYLLANPQVIREFIKVRQPYSTDVVSQMIATEVMRNRAAFEPGIKAIVDQRDQLQTQLRALPNVQVFESQANYILLRVPRAAEVWQRLYDAGVLIRDFSNAPGLQDCLRVTVGSEKENRIFFATLRDILDEFVGRD